MRSLSRQNLNFGKGVSVQSYRHVLQLCCRNIRMTLLLILF